MKKIILSIVSICVCLLAMSTASYAIRYENCADAMNTMGIFKGVASEYGVDYELGRGANRAESLVMLLRLLGEEETAKACGLSHNFVDVPAEHWAYPYVAYSLDKGYTAGVSATSFAPEDEININTYATFLLRALGYNDKNGDFTYDNAVTKTVEIGMLPMGTYSNGDDICLRDDCVYMSMRALNTLIKDTDTLLSASLISKGVIPAESVGLINEALAIADLHVTDAYKTSGTILPDSHLAYSEIEDGKVVKRMEHIVYYNPFAKNLFHYKYDENGKVTEKISTDSAASNQLYEYELNANGENIDVVSLSYFDEYIINGNLSYELTGTVFETSYAYGYFKNDGRLAEIMNEDNEDECIMIDYEGNTAYITLPDNDVNQLDSHEVVLKNVDTAIVKNSHDDVLVKVNYDANGVITAKYDAQDRPTYKAEINSDGKITKETMYQYAQPGNAFADTDSVSTVEYIYDAYGKLSKVIGTYPEEVEEYSFRYFGNNKLDRVLCKFSDGITWEQVHTAFDDYGHMKSPW